MNLSAIDLNLMVVLDALLSERSVTRAAERVGLSQPAMSNALGRLRALLDDPVLVRTGRGMVPTPRALEMATPVRQALATLSRAIAPPPSFDPQRSSHCFRIQTADHIEASLVPRLVEHLKARAPGVDLMFARVTHDTEEQLRSGRIDLYVGPWLDVPSRLRCHLLHGETFACIARRDHPVIRARLTLRQFVDLGHVLVAPIEQPGNRIDTALADQGLGRRVVVRTPHYLVAPLVVARTDLIATLPASAAAAFAEVLPLSVYRPPIDVSGFPSQMVWHPLTDEQPAHRWLRAAIMDLASDRHAW